MKKIYLLFIGLCLITMLKAQVSKTVEVTSGNLSSLLTEEEKSTITSLTLIGTVDARDFIATTKMPLLTELDLSQTKVTAIHTSVDTEAAISYEDTIGSYGYNPRESRSLFSSWLKSIKLPSTLKVIGTNGFSDCRSLTSIDIPPTVTLIGLYAFYGCPSLTSISIPSSVTYIEKYAFFMCSALKELIISPSIYSINLNTFYGCSSLTTLTIPNSVKEIGEGGFGSCTALTTVTLPESLERINVFGFMNCPNITSIYSLNPNPPEISADAFNTDKSICVVHVPYGSKSLYTFAHGWEDFKNIEESLPGFALSATVFSFDLGAQSATVEVNSPSPWTATSDQPWLTVSPSSGEGDQSLTLSAEANTTYDTRTAIVKVAVSETLSKNITVVQKGITNAVHLETAGTLTTQFTEQELGSITQLTITGKMDARDFKTIREKMSVIALLDISAATIEAYTNSADQLRYPENTLPQSNPEWIDSWDDHSLNEKTSLTTVVLPASLTGIGTKALEGCTGLQKMVIPSRVTRIDAGAFYGCTSLTECLLPSSLLTLGMHAFYGCSKLGYIELPPRLLVIDRYTFSECTSLAGAFIPESVTTIGENAFSYCSSLFSLNLPYSLKTIGSYAFYKCTGLIFLTIPSSVTAIYSNAFGGCSKLIDLELPRTLKILEPEAFGYCIHLREIRVYATVPLQLPAVSEAEPGVFNGIDQSKVILYVPEGSKGLYSAANQWKDFPTITEMDSFPMSAHSVTLEASQGMATVEIEPFDTWEASTNDSWITVSPLSGLRKSTITITAEDNPSFSRQGKVEVVNKDGLAQDIIVIQKGKTINNTIHVETAGTLYTYFTEDELTDLSTLILTGEIDARDFKLMRDKMPFLEVLDMKDATIKAYSGTEGTEENSTDYGTNEIPAKAFDNSFFERKSRLTTVVLPESITVIGKEAFSQCRSLTDIEIPWGVTTIDYYAFAGCTSITAMVIPSSVKTIVVQVFRGCKSLKTIELPSSVTELGNAAFRACDSLTSVTLPASLTTIHHRLFYSCSGLKTVEMGSAVTAIDDEAFFYCTSLESITIPASVTRIGYNAFTFCYRLATVYAYPVNPPDLSESGVVFSNVDLDKCILYVPIGTRELYASTSQWKDFKNIVEMGEFRLDATDVTLDAADNSMATVKLHSSLAWTATTDQHWLTVDPTSGTGGHELILTAQANPQDTARSAVVTITASDMNPLTLTVTQHGMAVGVDEMGNTARFTCYPNPFTVQMTIEVVNPLVREVTVEIYSMNGQKIKTLVRAQKGQKISLLWKGEDEEGKQVRGGMYLVKMNGRTMKVVKEGLKD